MRLRTQLDSSVALLVISVTFRQNKREMEGASSFETAPQSPPEEDFERTLRPKDFSEFLGQNGVLEPLSLMVRAAQEREETSEHILFTGLPGLGKTSLALALAQELGAPLKMTSDPALNKSRDLVGILSQIEPGTLLFIDEIHRIPRDVEEYLYGAMDRFQLEWTLDSGPHARLLKLDIQPFTLVGATTREALLSPPFRSRFGHAFRFEPYPAHELEQILERSASLLKVALTPEACARLAQHARGTPRIANRLLRRARDVAQVETNGPIDASVVERTYQLLDIDALGLERTDRKILHALVLAAGQPLGLKNLAVAIDEAEDTLEEVFEPWLIREGFLARTPQGRVILPLGRDALGLAPLPEGDSAS